MTPIDARNPAFAPVQDATADTDFGDPCLQVRAVEYGPHIVTIALSANGKFAGIVSVKTKRDFLSLHDRARAIGTFDLEKFYQD